jgi:hypothetical protein
LPNLLIALTNEFQIAPKRPIPLRLGTRPL